MSYLASEQRVQEPCNTFKGQPRCRIPQRLPPQGRQRVSSPPVKYKTPNNSELTKTKNEAAAAQHPRLLRPKSANKAKEDSTTGKPGHPNVRCTRADKERLTPTLKRPSTIPKRMTNENTVPLNRNLRATTPVAPKSPAKLIQHIRNTSDLPDQETLKVRQELELQSEFTDVTHDSIEERESIVSRSDVAQLDNSLQKNLVRFEKMKNELNERQKAVLELYAAMQNTHKMSTGQKSSLPFVEDLRIMNVANLNPDQLLQICTGSQNIEEYQQYPASIDVNKLQNLPSKLISICEQTLMKRKEIIDWFELLKSQQKGISTKELSKKIHEFYAENDMLKNSLDQDKAEFLSELSEILDILRKGVSETMNLRCHTEELTFKLAELSTQNTDLKKQIRNSDHFKSHSINKRIQELEKEVKEEKSIKKVMKDRLYQSEAQVKINAERSSQLEATLDQARSQIWSLERTVQQLHEQNQRLQTDFDKELNKLQESIRQNTLHLEEIADAREKLQSEKEDLEKQLVELSKSYNESLENMKHEMNNKVAMIIETEKKYNQEIEERRNVESKVETLCAQLLDSELRHKDLFKQFQEKESQLSKAMNSQKELDETKRKLELVNCEIEDYRNRLLQQGEAIKEIEQSFKETLNLERNLKNELSSKEEYIAEMEKKQSVLQQQLEESGSKVASYKEQLSSLKSHITQLQEDFGEFENLNELHEMVNKQRAKLLEATRQNGELAEALQKKDEELERHLENLAEQEHLLEQREGVIKLLSEKEEEQANIINILKNNLQMRTQADVDLNQQIAEKNTELDSLITNVETRKQQISQLEKIILTLEEQNRKTSLQRRKDQEKLAEYECYMQSKRSVETPTENIDNLFRILEDELGTPIDQLSASHSVSKKKYISNFKRDKPENIEYLENNYNDLYSADRESIPTKIVMGNFVKKTYLTNNEEQLKGESLDRKKAITNIDTQKWVHAHEPTMNMFTDVQSIKDKMLPPLRGTTPVGLQKQNLTKNVQYLSPNQHRDEKKCKMFKIAGHRL